MLGTLVYIKQETYLKDQIIDRIYCIRRIIYMVDLTEKEIDLLTRIFILETAKNTKDREKNKNSC